MPCCCYLCLCLFEGHDEHNQPRVRERAIPGIECNWWGELWAGCSVYKQITGWHSRDPLRAAQHGCWYVVCKTSMSLMNYTWENAQPWNWGSRENKGIRWGKNRKKIEKERERPCWMTIKQKMGVANHQELAKSRERQCFCHFVLFTTHCCCFLYLPYC